MNDPKDYTKTKAESWKKTVERYREDMMKLARQNERFSKPEPPKPQKNTEEDELKSLYERTKQAREELQRLEKEKLELEKLIEAQREELLPKPQPRTNDEVDFWSVEDMRRLPNAIPIPENELPFDNSSVVLPPPNEGPNEADDAIIDFDGETGEWQEIDNTLPAQQEVTQINEFISEATPADSERIIRPDYGVTQIDAPVEQHERTPTNMQNTPRDRFDTSQLTGSADLVVQVFTARQALPITGATVTVSRIINEDGIAQMMAVHITDENGKTPPINLPTPPQYLSETPGNGHPYSEYTVDVKKKGYFENNVRGIQMFDGITTIEPVNLIPLPSGQNSGSEEFDISDYEL